MEQRRPYFSRHSATSINLRQSVSDGHGGGDNERVIEDERRNPSPFPLVSLSYLVRQSGRIC